MAGGTLDYSMIIRNLQVTPSESTLSEQLEEEGGKKKKNGKSSLGGSSKLTMARPTQRGKSSSTASQKQEKESTKSSSFETLTIMDYVTPHRTQNIPRSNTNHPAGRQVLREHELESVKQEKKLRAMKKILPPKLTKLKRLVLQSRLDAYNALVAQEADTAQEAQKERYVNLNAPTDAEENRGVTCHVAKANEAEEEDFPEFVPSWMAEWDMKEKKKKKKEVDASASGSTSTSNSASGSGTVDDVGMRGEELLEHNLLMKSIRDLRGKGAQTRLPHGDVQVVPARKPDFIIPKVPQLATHPLVSYPENEELNALCKEVLASLHTFQKRVHATMPPEQWKSRRRYVAGLRECKKVIKLKAVVMAVNLEEEEALQQEITQLLRRCEDDGIPVIFALRRRSLAKVLEMKVHRISCVGIVSDAGCEQPFKALLEVHGQCLASAAP
jgi:ribosomal protein L7Ae-like RNA K-turn-binding protein